MVSFSMCRVLAVVLLSVTAPAAIAVPQSSPRPPIAVGERVPLVSSLRDVRGNRRSIRDLGSSRATVLVFTGIHCPLARLYTPRIVELQRRYRSKGVSFAGVYSNESETLDEIAADADDRGIPFLLLKDFGQRLADALEVTRTPQAIVLDGDLVLRYRGRIDDQYGVAYRKEKPASDDLTRAIDEVLAEKSVTVPETAADGCLLERASASPGKTDVTYARDVAPILQRRCQGCHRPGRIGPFSLLDYDDAVRRAAMIKEVTVQRRMPPWHADRRYGEFVNDRSMTAEEIGVIASWVDAGTPRGDPEDEPPPIDWPEGWTIGEPDIVLSMPEAVDVPADGVMPYLYFRSPTGFEEDRWVEKAEVRPGDSSVLHHVLVYVKLPGERVYEFDGSTTALVGWAPGDTPLLNPPGTAGKIPKGADLLWEVHYTPNGKATTDRTSVGLILAKEPPEREARVNIFAKLDLEIPAGEPHHRHENVFTFTEDSRVISLMPHMHLRGKSFKYEAIYPDDRTETLLSVPRWDFNWQTVYWFKEPVRVPAGTRLRAVAHWDNSRDNPLNPDATTTVHYGLQTWDEMMNGWIGYVRD